MVRFLVFDWGDTVMRVFPQYPGPMAYWPEVAAMPGAEAVLPELAKFYQLALATNAADSGADLVLRALERVGLAGFFRQVLTAKELKARKPEPEFYAALLSAISCAADEAVMVGDDYETDIRGAKKAGLYTVWLNWRERKLPYEDKCSADATITTLTGLSRALLELESLKTPLLKGE